MQAELIFAFLGYAFVTSLTPGPNNLMLLASGLNFGLRRSIPHAIGISLGFFLLLVAVGLGLGALLTAFPKLHLALKIAGAAYLLYLAWRIAMSRSISHTSKMSGRPMTLLEAGAFQWVNPKAWIMALGAMSVYVNPNHPYTSVLLISLLFSLINFPSVSAWAAFGSSLRSFLNNPNRLKWFNIIMGALLALSLWPLVR